MSSYRLCIVFGVPPQPPRIIHLPGGVIKWRVRYRHDSYAEIFLRYSDGRCEKRALEQIDPATVRPCMDFCMAENQRGK